jgi:protein-tyrosine-phosphatase
MIASEFLANEYGGKKAFVRYWFHALINIFLFRYTLFSTLPNNISRVVFVCKGNICRSALAERVFKSVSQLPCGSIGLDTVTGKQANELFQIIAQSTGFTLSGHRTTSLNDFNPQPNDLYVCMEPEQAYAVKAKLNTNRVVLLGLIQNRLGAYIHDPYSTNNIYAKKCSERIVKFTQILSEKMLKSKET